ncbi:MAG TPA: azurin [Steroidobacteraceae bacterium]|jgi:azurin|nr:azurin [Steroidobacteraceae bacterium]
MRLTRHAFAALLVIGTPALLLAAPAQAASKVCKLEISANDAIQYDKKQLTITADCTQVELTLTHTGKLPAQSMGHDWVLVKADDVQAVASDGLTAGIANGYVKKDDPRVIAHTKIVGGGESTSVSFATAALKKGQSYKYLCTFPGHNALMNGDFIIQ